MERLVSVAEFHALYCFKWKFMEHAPHIRCLWEETFKSFKKCIKQVLGKVKLNFEGLPRVYRGTINN